MPNTHDLAAQAKQLGEQALKLANTARVQAGRFAQENTDKIDAAIDKTAATVGHKTGKDFSSAAEKVKGAASKGAAMLAHEDAKADPAADMPVIPTDPPKDDKPASDS